MTTAEEDVILDELRTHGATVTVGGSRCHTDYTWDGQGFVAMPFDEGHTEVYPCSEASLRQILRDDPQPFRELLKRPHLRALRAAWAAGDRAAARQHLAAVRAVGDALSEGVVLDAVLADEAPPAEVLDLIREKVHGHTAWHAYMGLLGGWQRTAEVGQGGQWFADRLAALVGESPALEALRANFRALG